MSSPWMISIRNGKNKKNVVFPLKEDETPQENLERVKQAFVLLSKKYPKYVVEIISRKTAFPPKHKVKRGYTYCPYCRKDRLFQSRETTGYNHCPICGVSDYEYYVRYYNKIFD